MSGETPTAADLEALDVLQVVAPELRSLMEAARNLHARLAESEYRPGAVGRARDKLTLAALAYARSVDQ